MYCCRKISCFCLMLTLFRCPLITENNHLQRDPELSNVTRNCQIYIMPLDTLKIGIYKLNDFMNCNKVKRNNLLNSIYTVLFLQTFVLKRHPTLISLLTRNCRVHCSLIKINNLEQSPNRQLFLNTRISHIEASQNVSKSECLN